MWIAAALSALTKLPPSRKSDLTGSGSFATGTGQLKRKGLKMDPFELVEHLENFLSETRADYPISKTTAPNWLVFLRGTKAILNSMENLIVARYGEFGDGA